ncbi:MAG: hypothetical protein WHV66_15300, partial [Anaerolineales bacterium]
APTLMSEETLKTAQAELGSLSSTEQVPVDIPLPEGDKTVIVATDTQVQFQTTMSLADLTKFYKEKMPANGWRFEDKGSSEKPEDVTLIYKKDDRKATIFITDLTVTRLVGIDFGPE